MINSNYVLAHKLIALAGEHEGCVYGNFVRDVIIPNFYDPSLNPEFKEFDLWFKTQENFDNFVKKSRGVFEFDQYPVISGIGQRQKYGNLTGKHITINSVICDKFPFNEFDVDKLLFSSDNLKYYRVDESKQTALFIQNIKNKIVNVNIDYIENGESFEVIKRRFFDKGWIIRVKFEDVKFSKMGFFQRLYKYNQKSNLVIITNIIGYGFFFQKTEHERFKLLVNEGYFITQNEVINLESRPKIINVVGIGADNKDNTPKNLTDKDIMLYIFDQGLETINNQINLTDGKLKHIYANGQNKCRDDFQELINKL